MKPMGKNRLQRKFNWVCLHIAYATFRHSHQYNVRVCVCVKVKVEENKNIYVKRVYTFKAVVQVQHEHAKQTHIRPEEGILLLCCVVVFQLSFFFFFRFVDVKIICSDTDYFPYRLGIWRDMHWNTLSSYRTHTERFK